jgi:hypothetical protein
VGPTSHNLHQPAHDPPTPVAAGKKSPSTPTTRPIPPRTTLPPLPRKIPNLEPQRRRFPAAPPSAAGTAPHHLPPSPMARTLSESETSEAKHRRLRAERHRQQLFEQRRSFEESRRWLRAAWRPGGGYQAAMRRAVAFLGPYRGSDAEMSFALDLKLTAPTAAAGSATGGAVGEGAAAAGLAAHSGAAALAASVPGPGGVAVATAEGTAAGVAAHVGVAALPCRAAPAVALTSTVLMGGVAEAFPGRAGALSSPPASLVMGNTTAFVEHAAATSTA